MSERLGQARELGRRVDAGWRREDVEAQLARLHARQRVRARRRAIAAPVAAAAVTAMVFAAIPALRRDPPAAREAAVAERAVVVKVAPREVASSPAPPERAPTVVEGPALAAGALSLGDGSIVTPLAGGRLVAREVSDTDVVVALAGGGARFDVPDRAARRFRAELGGVALETRGAAFSVAIGRREVEVSAERGELTARWGRERQAVRAGETRAFAIAGPGDAARGAAGETTRGAVDDAMRGAAAPAAEPSNAWRDAAARGDYAAAWLALERAAPAIDPAGGAARSTGRAVGVPTPRDLASPIDPAGGAARSTGRAVGVPTPRDLASPIDPTGGAAPRPTGMADLLLAGDVARLSGHPAAAVTWLMRAAALHAGDPRAPLAAFTLGRVHLEELGAPRDAAQAFVRARELAPDGPLAEDALAREVEAWSRAGETETARARAEAYVRRYPAGHRLHAVRRFGGLEGP